MVPTDDAFRLVFTVKDGRIRGAFGEAEIDFTATWEPSNGMSASGDARISPGAFGALGSKPPAGIPITEGFHLTLTGKTAGGEELDLQEASVTRLGGTHGPEEAETSIAVRSRTPWVHLAAKPAGDGVACRALLRGFRLEIWPEFSLVSGPHGAGQYRDRLTIRAPVGADSVEFRVTDAGRTGYSGCAWLETSKKLDDGSFIRAAWDLKDLGQLVLGEQVDVLWAEFAEGGGRWRRLFCHCRPYLRVSPEPMTPTGDPGTTPGLADLFDSFRTLADQYRLHEVAEQLLRSNYVYLNDKRRELALTLETLADSHDRAARKGAKPQPPVPKRAYRKVLPKLRMILRDNLGAHEEGLKILGERLASSLNAPTNQAKHLSFLNGLGMTLTKEEEEAVLGRNPALHGAPFIPLGATPQEVHNEVRACWILRTLLNKAVLRILGYRGPYVDYGTPGFPDRPIE